MTTGTVNARCRWSDGHIDTLYPLELREEGEDIRARNMYGLDSEGWWHSFRHLSEVDDHGYVIFEEDPHAEKTKHTGPRQADVTNKPPDTTLL
jgi:hypothetical protein